MLRRSVIRDAQRHARAEYPRESCGLMINDVYIPCRNIAEDPTKDFVIDPKDRLKAEKTGQIRAVIHSHPGGPMFPSESDMTGQIASGVAWAIIGLDEDRMSEPFVWGGDTPVPPLLGRDFRHGVTDCLSLIRDTFRLGREACMTQGVDWPFEAMIFDDIARADCWWDRGDDLYLRNFERWGFSPVMAHDIKPGDVFLTKIRSEQLNHGGVLLNDGLILHHLPGRLSRREPAGLWGRSADMWIRREGAVYAA